MTGLLQRHGDHLRLRVRVQPGAGSNSVVGVEHDAEGTAFLKLRVTQAPEDGKANRAVTRLLAKAWRVPASAVTVVTGHKARRKVLEIDASDEATERIRHWLEQFPT